MDLKIIIDKNINKCVFMTDLYLDSNVILNSNHLIFLQFQQSKLEKAQIRELIPASALDQNAASSIGNGDIESNS